MFSRSSKISALCLQNVCLEQGLRFKYPPPFFFFLNMRNINILSIAERILLRRHNMPLISRARREAALSAVITQGREDPSPR